MSKQNSTGGKSVELVSQQEKSFFGHLVQDGEKFVNQRLTDTISQPSSDYQMNNNKTSNESSQPNHDSSETDEEVHYFTVV